LQVVFYWLWDLQLAKVKLSFNMLHHFGLCRAGKKIEMFAELNRSISHVQFP